MSTSPSLSVMHGRRVGSREVGSRGVDPVRWPDVARVPGSRIHASVAGALVRRAARRVPVQVVLGEEVVGSGPRLDVHDPEAFLRRLGTGGLIGFGESYMAGEWDADDPVAVLTVLAQHVDVLAPPPLQRLRRLWAPRLPARHRNTMANARRNVGAHYDLSNDLFALFLDTTMTYSSALFADLPARWDDLAAAQRRKIDRVLDLAGVGSGTRLLEIGTGWGELAARAGRRGARVVSVTLSEEQRAQAVRRVRAAGLDDRVTVRTLDYRQAEGTYDAVVSVEMIEAVGEEHWPLYFATVADRLAPGGAAVLQAITMPHRRLLATRRTHTWVQKYIFPGGLLPSTTAMEEAAAAAGLRVTASDGLGPHYAETLRLWRERFLDRWGEVGALGFDETFRRMWTLYLAHSEAGFRSGYLDVRQITLVRVGDDR